MSKSNPLGLLVNYGDSDDDSDDGVSKIHKRNTDTYVRPPSYPNTATHQTAVAPEGVHPSPIPHCPWSACYDENSGFTYYWNQYTNAVTWEAPPEYLLALKLAQQQLHISGSTEVSAEEWQLYQQALAEKQNVQNKTLSKTHITKLGKKMEKPGPPLDKNKKTYKRPASDDEEKIELITSYHNSDSESNDELEKPIKPLLPKPSVKKPQKPQPPQKKIKKPQVIEYGPSLPPNQNYSVPIGPELPPELANKKPKSPEKAAITLKNEDTKSTNDDDNQDEDVLLKRLKDKAKLLEKLGGEIPSELQKIIKDETKSVNSSPKIENTLDIDDLLEEIEKKELPKVKGKGDDAKVSKGSGSDSPSGVKTPPLEDLKELYPNGNFRDNTTGLFPSAVNIDDKADSKPETPPPQIPIEKEKKENVYLLDSHESIGTAARKKLRISNSVLPERKKVEIPAYTTKYSHFIEGFSTERTGLGFTQEENAADTPKNTISYGNGLTFTKGETLNEEKKDDSLDDLLDLVEAKLKYLNQIQPCQLTQIQEMLIQINVVWSALRAGALSSSWARDWAQRAASALARHEAAAAPPGWTTLFQRSEARYCYRREADGLLQWEYPATSHTDMEICTTPPPPEPDKARTRSPSAEPGRRSPWARSTPPPPGTELAPSPTTVTEPKKEIGDELMSFYNDIAELEKETVSKPSQPAQSTQVTQATQPTQATHLAQTTQLALPTQFTPATPPAQQSTRPSSPEPPPPPEIKERDIKMAKKKSKMKISTSLSIKNKSVSSLVAKWQQVAEEIDSD